MVPVIYYSRNQIQSLHYDMLLCIQVLEFGVYRLRNAWLILNRLEAPPLRWLASASSRADCVTEASIFMLAFGHYKVGCNSTIKIAKATAHAWCAFAAVLGLSLAPIRRAVASQVCFSFRRD